MYENCRAVVGGAKLQMAKLRWGVFSANRKIELNGWDAEQGKAATQRDHFYDTRGDFRAAYSGLKRRSWTIQKTAAGGGLLDGVCYRYGD